MTELMKAKLPQPMWNDALCFAKRYDCAALQRHGVVATAPPAAQLLEKALEVAQGLRSKGKDQKTRETLKGIKGNLYKVAVEAMSKQVEDMGFATGTWDPTGRASKL